MTNQRINSQQAVADAAVKAAKERQRLVELAERATIAPESLSYDEIKAIGRFVIVHGDCWTPGPRATTEPQ